jgi:hypothetical protein
MVRFYKANIIFSGCRILIPANYAQDLMNIEALGVGLLKPWLDLGTLPLTIVLFLQPSIKLHQRSRVLGF